MCVMMSVSVQAKTLKIATLAPAGTNWMKEMKAGAKLIKERTEGRVKLKWIKTHSPSPSPRAAF